MKNTIPVADAVLNGNEKKYVDDCLDSGWISSNGKYVEEFEREFSRFCTTKHAVSCCNGTVSLHLSLLAHDIRAGDEVIIPDLTYIATANAVRYCGANPVFADVEPDTWNINPKKIEEKISDATKGIIVVHLFGHPSDMDPILKIAKKHALFVIEDAAEAHGAVYKNRIAGSLGDCGSFSFYGNKIITTGEGGMVTTDNRHLADTVRLLKGQGVDPNRTYWHPVIGYNYRMTNIEAAIGLAQLENISWHLQRRREVAQMYTTCLEDLRDWIQLPTEKKWARHAFWMYSVVLKDTVRLSRDDVMAELQKAGIETRPFFYPVHELPPYRESDGTYPVAEAVSSRGINLPTHAGLAKDDIRYISETIAKMCKK